jgi:hypothetical protein
MARVYAGFLRQRDNQEGFFEETARLMTPFECAEPGKRRGRESHGCPAKIAKHKQDYRTNQGKNRANGHEPNKDVEGLWYAARLRGRRNGSRPAKSL